MSSSRSWRLRFPNLKESRIIKTGYKALFYFELGKGTTARFYQIIPDLIIILGGLKFLMGVDITPSFSVMFVLTVFFMLTVLGYFINKTGLYAVDRYVQASKDPVQKELLEAARRINKK